MPTNVHIRYKDCGPEPCITVNKPLVRMHKDGTIKFHNKLQDSDPDDSYLEIFFYDADDKDGTPLTNFCGPSSGDKLVVEKGKWEPCDMEYDSADYAYSVHSDGYVALDPIIIIEPETYDFGFSPLLALAILAVVGAIAYFLGRRKSVGSG